MRKTIVTICLCLLSISAEAQTVAPPLTVEGWTRVESRGFADFGSTPGNDPESVYAQVRFTLKQERGRYGLLIQPQATFREITGAVPTNGNSRGEQIAFHQAAIEFHDRKNGTLRLGRQELEFGGARLIAASGWTYCGRSFDAARIERTNGSWHTDGFVGRLGQAVNKTTNPALLGIYVTHNARADQGTDIYLLRKTDHVSGSGLAVNTLGIRERNRIGRWSGTSEVAGQGGRNGGRAVRAWAGYAAVVYRLGGRYTTSIGTEYDYASGGNPSDPRTVATFDQLFPNNHYLYGIADVQGWRNIRDLSWNIRTKIRPQAQITLETHQFALADARDYWYGDNGAVNRGRSGKALRDPSGSSGTAIGREFDLYGTVMVRPPFTISGGLAIFRPGAFVRSVNGGNAHPSRWVYLRTNYRF